MCSLSSKIDISSLLLKNYATTDINVFWFCPLFPGFLILPKIFRARLKVIKVKLKVELLNFKWLRDPEKSIYYDFPRFYFFYNNTLFLIFHYRFEICLQQEPEFSKEGAVERSYPLLYSLECGQDHNLSYLTVFFFFGDFRLTFFPEKRNLKN